MKSILAFRRALTAAGLVLLSLVAVPRALATHLRGGTLSWVVTSHTATTYTVQFTLTESQRWSYNSGNAGSTSCAAPNPNSTTSCVEPGTAVQLGTYIGPGEFYFGDGVATASLPGTVTSVNEAQDYATAIFVFSHTYNISAGPTTAFLYATNRIDALKLGAEAPEYISTIVSNYAGSSPVAAVPAILSVPLQNTAMFNLGSAVSDTDPNVNLVFRLSSFMEIFGPPSLTVDSISKINCPSGVEYTQGGVASGNPPGFSISSAGVVTWDETQIHAAITGGNCELATPQAGDLWTAQVMVETHDKTTNAIITKVPIDLLMQFVTTVGAAPTVTLVPPGPQTVNPGTPVSFTATGRSTNSGAVVTLNASGVPSGAFTNGLNATVMPPIVSNFTWTPNATQTGNYVVTYTVTDGNLQQSQASETIIVANLPTISCSAGITPTYGTTGTVSATLNDPTDQNEPLSVVWTVDGTAVQTDPNLSAYPTALVDSLTYNFGSVGPHTVTATATNSRGVSVSCSPSVTVVKANQTINFGPLTSVTYGVPDFGLGATSSSGLPVSYTAAGNCALTGATTVHIASVGSCLITAMQGGNSNYNTAMNVSQSFSISPAPVMATAGSGTSIYDSTTKAPPACSITGSYTAGLSCVNVPSVVGPDAGTTPIAASVTGVNSNFTVTSVSGSYTINKANSSISLNCPASVTYTGLPLTPCSATVTGVGGLSQSVPVTYSPNTNAGLVTASAVFSGDTDHLGSGSGISFNIMPAAQVITFTPVPTSPDTAGDSVVLSATGGASGQPVVFSVLSGPATLANDGVTLTYTGAGSVTVAADQAASDDGNYAVAMEATATIVVNPAAGAFNAGTVPVGSQSSVLTATLNFPNGGMLGSLSYLTQGAANLDYIGCTSGPQTKKPVTSKGGSSQQTTFSCPSSKSKAGTGVPVCSVGTAYSAGQICTVSYIFQPQYPGQRLGAVAAVDNNGNPMGTSYLSGLGTGPQISFSPAVQSVVGTGYIYPSSVAVDAAGDVFIADYNQPTLFEVPAGGGPTVPVGSGFGQPTAVAVDGAGNLYVTDGLTGITYQLHPIGGGAYSAPTNIAGFTNPQGLAVDGKGDVFVIHNTFITELLQLDGAVSATGATANVSTGFGGSNGFGPRGVAVDSNGNVYVADTVNNALLEVPAGCLNSICTLNLAPGSFNQPHGLALDASGDVYVGDFGTGTIKKYVPSTGTVVTLAGSFPNVRALTIDSSGNLYVIDTSQTVKKLDVADAPSVTFADTNVGSASSSNPQTVIVGNNGYDPTSINPLTFSGVSTGTANFALDATNACSTSTSLEPGQTCALSVDFAPQSSGTPLTDAVTLADNNLNNISSAASPQTVPLSGNGLQQTPFVTVAAATFGYGLPTYSFTATVSFAGTTAPTGAITFSIDGGASISGFCSGSTSPLACTAGGSPTGTLGAGTHTITASIAATPGFLQAYGSNTLTVTPAALTVTAGSYTGVYDGSSHAVSDCVVSANPDGLRCTNNPVGPVGPNVGGTTVTPSISVSTSNYSVTINNGSWSITPLAVTVTAGSYSGVYDGHSHALSACTSSYAGVTCTNSPASVGPGAGSDNVNPVVSYASGIAADYTVSNVAGAYRITKLAASVTPNAGTKVYGTSDPVLTGTLSGFLPADGVTATYSRTSGETVAGSPYTISATLSPAAALSNYAITYSTAYFTITKATPVVTWTAPAAITYGTALSGAQLDATAPVAGGFSYSPGAGTVPHAGSQALSVTFTPTDTADYSQVTTGVSLTVNKATPTIMWPKPAAINYGTPLGAAQLDATASTGGTFIYSPAAGSVLLGGTQALSVSFTPTDTADYNGATAANTITVNGSTVTLGVSSGTQTYETWTNFVLGPTWSGNYATSKVPTGTVTLYNNGVAWVTLKLGSNGLAYYTSTPPLNVGVNNLTASYSGDANYPPGLSAVVTITVLPAPVNFQATCVGALVYTQTYQCTVNLSASTTSPPVGSIQYSLDGAAPVTVAINSLGNAPFTVPTVPSAGSHTLVITYGGQGNYAAAKPITYNFTTQKGQTQLHISSSGYVVAHGSSVTLSGSATSLASGVPGGSVTFYDNGAPIGTSPIGSNGAVSYTVTGISKGAHNYSASYAGAANYAAATSGLVVVTAY